MTKETGIKKQVAIAEERKIQKSRNAYAVSTIIWQTKVSPSSKRKKYKY